MAANRSDSAAASIAKIHSRGGLAGFYQGLVPWAWVEASTKGAVLLFVAAETEPRFRNTGFSATASAALSGMCGGVAQAYATMGFCTFMKTVEVTRAKSTASPQSTFAVARDIFAREGIVGMNKCFLLTLGASMPLLCANALTGGRALACRA